MGNIQEHALPNTIFNVDLIRSFECGIHHTPEERQIMMIHTGINLFPFQT